MLRSFAKTLLRLVAGVLFRVRIEGRVPVGQERLLVIANHESFLDGLLLGLFLPLNPVFVVHTTVVKNPMFRLVLMLVDYLTVDPTSPMAMKKVVRLIGSGRPVVIFPGLRGHPRTRLSSLQRHPGLSNRCFLV